jgi:hypothetical protein
MSPSIVNRSLTGLLADRHPPHRKSVLFCQGCGHESSIDGDWRTARIDRRTDDERLIYTCPECARTVAVRPDRGRETDGCDSHSRIAQPL